MTEPVVNPAILEKLRAPFPDEAVGKLPKSTCKACTAGKCDSHKATVCRVCKAFMGRHIHLDYVGHAYVRERLNEVDPAWTWRPMATTANGMPAFDDDGGLWIALTVGGKTQLGYGDAPGKRGSTAVKEVIGDALRNAAMSFGVALDLWKKEPAPGVAADSTAAPVQTAGLSEDQQRAALRGQISKIGGAAGMSVTDIGDDFVAWSQGTEIRAAGVAALAAYVDVLNRRIAEQSDGGS